MLPDGDGKENRLRPYLPAVTKQAWHLDKQSLKGLKRQKLQQQAGGAAPSAPPGPGSSSGEGAAAAASEPPAAPLV